MDYEKEYGFNKILNDMFDKRFDERKYEIFKKILVANQKMATRLAETGDAGLVAKELSEMLEQLD